MSPLLFVGLGAGALWFYSQLAKAGSSGKKLTAHPQAGETWTLVFDGPFDFQAYAAALGMKILAQTKQGNQYVATVTFERPTTMITGPWGDTGVNLVTFAKAPIFQAG